MRNESYLIEKMILYSILTILAVWGINYGVSRIADQIQKVTERPFEPKSVSL